MRHQHPFPPQPKSLERNAKCIGLLSPLSPTCSDRIVLIQVLIMTITGDKLSFKVVIYGRLEA